MINNINSNPVNFKNYCNCTDINLPAKTKNNIDAFIDYKEELYTLKVRDLPGFVITAESIEQIKEKLPKYIDKYKLEKTQMGIIPNPYLKAENIKLNYNVYSFMHAYNGLLTKSAIERLSGINQKLLGHYYTGIKSPGKEQSERLSQSIQTFAKELSQAGFYYQNKDGDIVMLNK